LIEKYRENLLTYSNQFDTTWSSSNTTETGGQAGYDGTNDAWLLEKSASSAFLWRSFSGSGVYSLSLYAKAGTLNSVFVLIVASGGNGNGYFNLSTGTVGTFGNNAFDAQIEDVGNGWYRCSLIGNYTNISQVRIYPANGESLTDTSGNIYIQDAQLERGLVATDYIETDSSTASAGVLDDLPRIDYTGGSASLLLEPQRTNICTNSEDVSNWSLTFATVTPNDTISPEGVQNAAKIVTSNLACDVKLTSIPVSPSTTYTATFYCKLTSGSGLQTRFYDNTNGANIEYYDYSSQLVVGEWKRVTRTFTTPAGCNNIQIWFLAASSSASVTAHYWGYQLEEGSYPTSYIPTYGVSATREEDNMDTTFSSPLSTDGGVSVLYYIKGTDKKSGISANARYLNFATDSGLTTPYIAYNRTDEEHRVRVYDGTVSTYSKAEVDIENDVKIVVVAEGDTHKVFSNGVLRYTRTTNSIDWSSITDFVHTSNDDIGVIDVKQALLFPTALTDAECIALTTL
jgi:hypothetical protein